MAEKRIMLGVALALILVAGTAFLWFEEGRSGGGEVVGERTLPLPNESAGKAEEEKVEEMSAGGSLREPPAGWKEYRSDAYRFSVLYSEPMEVSLVDEGGGASTVVFEDVENVRGFQIFITPYGETQVTEERFAMDLPSGVRTNMEDITIDGAVGAAFYSMNDTLGETREIWFIRDGYLYEVTTLRSLDLFIEEIMRSWQFLP